MDGSIKKVFRTAIEFNVSKYFANLKLHLIKAVSTQTVSGESGLERLHSWQDMTPLSSCEFTEILAAFFSTN